MSESDAFGRREGWDGSPQTQRLANEGLRVRAPSGSKRKQYKVHLRAGISSMQADFNSTEKLSKPFSHNSSLNILDTSLTSDFLDSLVYSK